MARSDHRPGSQLPVTPTTLADVAERAGVSRQTVSNAVNNPDLLRPDTLERVRQTIAELGYSPNRAARNLRTRTSSLIGLRFTPAQEGTANAMMDRFVHSLVEASDEAGYHVLLFPADDEDPVGGYDNLLRSTAVDAFVVTDTYLGNPQAAWLSQQRAPFVAFGRPWDDDVARHVVGRRRRRRRHRAWPRSTSSTAATRASRGSAGARTRPSARTAARAGSRRCTPTACRPRGWPRASRTSCTAAPRRPPCSSTSPSRPPSSARPTPSRWACCTRSGSASSPPAATSRSSASTTPRWRRSSRWASRPYASRSRTSRSRSSGP